MQSPVKNKRYPRIYAVVQCIPLGYVSTYGDIARFAGLARQARMVGYALHALPNSTGIPWHRVINAQGTLSVLRCNAEGENEQQKQLEQEGIEFKTNGTVDLKRFRWQPEPFELPGWDPLSG